MPLPPLLASYLTTILLLQEALYTFHCKSLDVLTLQKSLPTVG